MRRSTVQSLPLSVSIPWYISQPHDSEVVFLPLDWSLKWSSVRVIMDFLACFIKKTMNYEAQLTDTFLQAWINTLAYHTVELISFRQYCNFSVFV